MPPSAIETLSVFHCDLKDSGLCTVSRNVECVSNLPECSQNDACPEINLSLYTEPESAKVAVTVIAVILTLSGIVILGYLSLMAWNVFQNKLLQPKILTFDVYDPYDLPDTKPKYFIID